MYPKNLYIFFLFTSALLFCPFNILLSQQFNESRPLSTQTKIEFGSEFMWPSSSYQTIHTISTNAFFFTNYFKKAKLNIDFGATSTYAWGTSLDWYDLKHELKYINTSAWGAGPVIHINQSIFEMNRFSIEGSAAGAIILYNKRFPPGGDIYNFMLRTGLDFGYLINNEHKIKLEAKWMHVSNGKGSGPHNPYYEGYGLGLNLTKYLYKQ